LKAKIHNISHGANFQYVEPVNLYGCTLGDDVFVGPFVEITSGVVIGNRVRIQSHTFICSGVTIGDDVFVGHGVMFTNDPFKIGRPARGDANLYRPTNIGDRVAIGSGVALLPVNVVADAVIGAGSVVTRNIDTPGIYAGNPARLLRPA